MAAACQCRHATIGPAKDNSLRSSRLYLLRLNLKVTESDPSMTIAQVNALQSSTCHTLQLAVPGVRAGDFVHNVCVFAAGLLFVVNGSLVTEGHAVTKSTYGIVSGLDLCAEDLRVEVNGRQLTVSGRRPVLPAQGRATAPAIHYTDIGE